MSPWQALIAEKTKPNRAELEVARRLDAQAQAPLPNRAVPAAALVVTLEPPKSWNSYPVPLGAKLVPIQVIDFFKAAAPHNQERER